jgi:hypothetical protein
LFEGETSGLSAAVEKRISPLRCAPVEMMAFYWWVNGMVEGVGELRLWIKAKAGPPPSAKDDNKKNKS